MKRKLRELAILSKAKWVLIKRGETVSVRELAREMGISRNCLHSILSKNQDFGVCVTLVDYKATSAWVAYICDEWEQPIRFGNLDELELCRVFEGWVGKYASYKQLRLSGFD